MMQEPGSANDPLDDENVTWDPVFINSRREAWVILCFWLVALIWVVPVSYLMGYQEPTNPEEVAMVMGIPSWLFWGVAAPWVIADIATIWFCFFYMKDDDLGEDVDEAHGTEGEV